MRKHIFLTLFALIITGILSVPAMALDHSHSVWTNNSGGRKLVDPDLGCVVGNFFKFRMVSSWTEISPGYAAEAHFRGVALTDEKDDCGEHLWEFTLNTSSTTTPSTITGTWDVRRDGTLVCSACTGQAINMNVAVSSFYDVLVDDPVYGTGAWNYSGYVTAREDF
jgi:hypothetical protein